MKYLKVSLWISLSLSIALGGDVFAKLRPRLIVKKKPSQIFMRKAEAFQKEKLIIEFENKKQLQNEKERLMQDDSIEWVVEDKLMGHFFEPGDDGTEEDQLWFLQWHYHSAQAGINLPAAWDITKGDEVVVAVVDTGITSHIDLAGKVLPGGDLITDPLIANDGGGRDNDASDPGDWVGFGDPCYSGTTHNSSWHGTHVAGTIAAKTGNGHGVAGISFGAKIVPVRVLGKCGGWASDIADGIKWAAGVAVSGLAPNLNPARVINLSLGGRGSCSPMMQEAIDAANNVGALVVVAAGNSNQNIDFIKYSPANCNGVVTVASTDENGDKSSFSNYGEFIDVSAPGGGEVGVMSTTNSGATSPSSDDYIQMKGTSMAAPHVSGVATLMISVNPNLSPAQLRQVLNESAKGFPPSSSCDSSICGEGIIDAENAVMIAQSTPADPDFVFNEPITSNTSEPVTISWFNSPEEEGGGACGTVEIDKGGPGGPFIFSLLFGLLLSLVAPGLGVNKSR